jgi:CRP/FNR family transcriptional regulator, cyclic AMP receptor protein
MSGFMAAFERFAVTFQKGDMIFCEYEPGDAFYLIQEGRVRISKVIGDIEKTLDVLQPGEVFGEMAILEGTPRSASAFAVDRVKALQFNKENFEILMQGNPQIILKILRLFTKRIYDQRRRFKVLTIEDPVARIGDVFLMLSESNPDDQCLGEKRVFDTSMEDIAQWAGLPIEKARESLNHMVSQRRISIERDKIVVNNIHDLVRMVNSRRKGN